MNDELKNKSGKVKVMYVRSDDDSDKRTQNPRTGKGGGRPASRADGGRRPARDDRKTAVMTANVIVSVTIANAMTVAMT
jgi:TrmH RNA methyltransferase